ncbi:MAG TPA: M28 family peptidase [Telluria sp.]|nr:M28 family peptidase [Telluria sp.]
MRNFLSTHWKTLVAILVLVFVALLTLSPSAASPDLPAQLRRHVEAVATVEHNTATPAELERAARYIQSTLERYGYAVTRQEYKAGGAAVRNIEVSLANVAKGKRPERIFIVGAHYDSARGAPGANDNGSGTAAVLELARLMRNVTPSPGTELKFVFFVNDEPPWFMGDDMGSMRHAQALHRERAPVHGALVLETIGWYSNERNSQRLPPGLEGRYPDTGNFIAFVGTRASSALVGQALAAFRAASDFPAHGLAAPAYVQGVTLSDHSSYNRFGYPALMITDTAFLRYPYYHTAEDTPDKLDYDSLARVVSGLAHTIGSLAGTTRS